MRLLKTALNTIREKQNKEERENGVAGCSFPRVENLRKTFENYRMGDRSCINNLHGKKKGFMGWKDWGIYSSTERMERGKEL